MSLLSWSELTRLVSTGIIEGSSIELVNSSSIDIRMGNTILRESYPGNGAMVHLDKKDKLFTEKVTLKEDDEYVLMPGEFILASSLERFNLPLNISAEYKLKSSMARIGLEHLNAGWCDAGWHGSVLTLELRNMTSRHGIVLKPGVRIGQIVFFSHDPVPESRSYAVRGSYNNDVEATGVKTVP